MRVKFWGVRGSIPAPLNTEQLQEKLFHALSSARGVDLSDPSRVRAYIAQLDPWIGRVVGGNTTCVEVDAGDEPVIIDCGSGMRELGTALMSREFGRGRGTAHIFLTHAHWDHLQGFPFFAPAYVSGNRLVIYAVGANPRQYLDHQQVAPTYFPIATREYRADLEYVQLKEGEAVQLDRLTITNLALRHPGTAYSYRLDDGACVFVFASDGEYKPLDDVSLRRFINFFSGADVLAFDSQYSLRDLFLSKADWGHSSVMIGVDIAARAGVKRLVTVHHDPSDSDKVIHEVADAARQYSKLNPTAAEVDVIVGADGLELFVGAPLGLETVEDTTRDVWLLALAGRLHAATADQAREKVSAFLLRAPDHKIILDLTLVASLDVLGVRALAEAIASTPGADVAFVSPAPAVRRALQYAGEHEVGPIYRRRHHALAALSGPSHLRLTGQLFEERYQLGTAIDADDFGAIYPATEVETGDALLVQVLGEESGEANRRRFAERARGWCSLRHSALVPGRKVYEYDALVAYVGERPAGRAWRDWLAGAGDRTSIPAGLTWMRRMLEALRAAHAQGVVHGDLRPECVVLQGDQPLISRAPLFAGDPSMPSAYRAPEQLRGEPATPACDVFATSVMLYEALTGAHPFTAEHEELMLARQLQGVPLSPRVFRPDIPARLEAFLLRLLASDPEDRCDSIDDVLAEIRRLLKPDPDIV